MFLAPDLARSAAQRHTSSHGARFTTSRISDPRIVCGAGCIFRSSSRRARGRTQAERRYNGRRHDRRIRRALVQGKNQLRLRRSPEGPSRIDSDLRCSEKEGTGEKSRSQHRRSGRAGYHCCKAPETGSG